MGAVLLSLFYAAFKRGFPHVGVLGFALSTFGLSTALLIGPAAGYEALEASVPLCQSQGFLIQFFALACVIYYLGIVLTLFVVVMLKDLEGSHKVTRFLYYGQHALLLAAFLVALLSLELGEFGVGSYGFRGMWCWVAGAVDDHAVAHSPTGRRDRQSALAGDCVFLRTHDVCVCRDVGVLAAAVRARSSRVLGSGTLCCRGARWPLVSVRAARGSSDISCLPLCFSCSSPPCSRIGCSTRLPARTRLC